MGKDSWCDRSANCTRWPYYLCDDARKDLDGSCEDFSWIKARVIQSLNGLTFLSLFVSFKRGVFMCGIVGIVSADEVAPVLVKSIARLEYCGYDSCGVATLGPTGIEVRKDAGAVEEVAFREGLAWLAGPFASYIRAGRLTRWYRSPMRTRT